MVKCASYTGLNSSLTKCLPCKLDCFIFLFLMTVGSLRLVQKKAAYDLYKKAAYILYKIHSLRLVKLLTLIWLARLCIAKQIETPCVGLWSLVQLRQLMSCAKRQHMSCAGLADFVLLKKKLASALYILAHCFV
jgi:hypothetical protein